MQSSWEARVERFLKRNKIKYTTEFKVLRFRKYRIDFVIKIWWQDIWIEVDWLQHFRIKSIIYDRFRDYKIKKQSGIKKIYRLGYRNLEKNLKNIIIYERFIATVKLYSKITIVSYIAYYLINLI